MTTLSADATSMANLLSALTQPDTEAIRHAELALKPILKDPRCVPALVEILKAKETQVRAHFHFDRTLRLFVWQLIVFIECLSFIAFKPHRLYVYLLPYISLVSQCNSLPPSAM